MENVALDNDVNDKVYGRQLIRDLEQSDGSFSIDMLKAMREIESALTAKMRLEHKTLESILGNTNRKRRKLTPEGAKG